jgi:hypothetical protein
VCTSWSEEETATEEIEMCPPKHLALQHFQAIDMAFDGAGAPRQRDPGFDRRIVLLEPSRKTLERPQRAARRTGEPGIQLGWLPLAYQGGKVCCQVDRLRNLWSLRAQLGQLLRFRLRAWPGSP